MEDLGRTEMARPFFVFIGFGTQCLHTGLTDAAPLALRNRKYYKIRGSVRRRGLPTSVEATRVLVARR